MNWKTPAAPVAGSRPVDRSSILVRRHRERHLSFSIRGGEPIADQRDHDFPRRCQGWSGRTRRRRRARGPAGGTDILSALLGPLAESLLLLQLLDEVGDGRLQSLPPSRSSTSSASRRTCCRSTSAFRRSSAMSTSWSLWETASRNSRASWRSVNELAPSAESTPTARPAMYASAARRFSSCWSPRSALTAPISEHGSTRYPLACSR